MTALRLRSIDSERDILVLDPGVHILTPSLLHPESTSDEPVANVYVDSRGVWLQLRDGVRGAYVNGRALRHMAMLRAGDALFVEGVECVLLGRRPEPVSTSHPPARATESRAVLRCVAGRHHGRCFPLDRPVTLGRERDCVIPLDDDAIASRELELEPVADGIRAHVAGRAGLVSANGYPVTDVLLHAGDQLVVGGQHRFVVEAARPAGGGAGVAAVPGRPTATVLQPQLRRAARRVPWLLLAAAMLAGALSLLLLYGAR